MGFISSLGLGKMLGFISFADISQAFILGLFGAIGGWLGKKAIVYLIKSIRIQILNFRINQIIKQKNKRKNQ